ncbi:MAG: response regulator [Candidatus Aminicenantes bacterium]|nr:response regulator [Candidatus Aminicenantes bacterium]NIM80628.1 response regulator [Candidatus Aminicenantes bacterium]NIN20009.1 response regulator [Candidatus Aminicenantes bacterium]NIN47987.1 response regulator [Candidatus Aminicenantes bacterium]NIN89333.1 response regulator [Candidatus Aminicenantes bacterium]
MFQEPVKILVVDDDASIRNMLSIVLKNSGYDAAAADSSESALKRLKTEMFHLIISDIKMPGISGIELLKKIKVINPEIPVIMITAFASTNDAVEAMKLGAEDYITKPFNLDELKLIIEKSLYKKDIENENIKLKSQLSDKEKFENIVGKSHQMLKIFELIDTISQTDSTVLITGESGTGKELIARAIHNKSPRRNKEFISINCGALPENLLESELFGHIKGSFTDAYKDKEGLFEQADEGTLFLDEIAEMSQKMQVKLLRAIQEKKIRRVGSNKEIEVDVRIISATNKDLTEEMKKGEFRSDLFYRLNVISIFIPPLRERKADIPLLLNYFLKYYNKRFNRNIKGFEKEILDLFMNYPWSGNIRELENFVERAVALEKSEYIGLNSLPTELIYNISEKSAAETDISSMLLEGDFDFSQYIDDISQKIILKALELNNANIKKTAAMLKLNYRSLRYLLDKYNLKGK